MNTSEGKVYPFNFVKQVVYWMIICSRVFPLKQGCKMVQEE